VGIGTSTSRRHDGDAPTSPRADARDRESDGGAWTRLATRLFERAHTRPRIAERYEIVGHLGRGGMGVVYAAIDHELGRKVAIKLLHLPLGRDGLEARARIRHEALALARLADPHVVAIYDVCEHEGQLALVMEHVEGENLRVHLGAGRPTDWRDVVALLLAAGQGLAAAHEAGLVHGDVKPDNILVGADGRVRVVDFGLAVAWHEPTDDTDDPAITRRWHRGPGTPRYMAPEQIRGEPVGPWTDQFALCIAMREALDGRHPFGEDSLENCLGAIALGRYAPRPASSPVPLAVHRAIDRGLAVDPVQRWPSVRALLAAIDRAVAPRPMPWSLALGVLALLGTGAALARAGDDPACHAAGAPPWVHHDRPSLRQAVLATNLVWADDAWTRIETELGQFASGWTRARDQACASMGTEQRERMLACLARVGRDADARAQIVLESSARTLPGALEAIASLPDPGDCLDSDEEPVGPTSGAVALEDGFARVRALHAAGRYGEALPLARDLVGMAEASDRATARVEAALELGGVLEAVGDYEQARRRLEEAALAAEASGFDLLAAKASARLVFLYANRLRDPTNARRWLRHAEAASRRVGDPIELRARIAASEGHVLEAEGDYARAREIDRRAVEFMAEAFGPDHPTVATATHNLGYVTFQLGDFAEARTLYERVIDSRVRTLGADHPLVGTTYTNLGAALDRLGDLAGAEERQRQAVAVAERSLGPEHPQLAAAYANLAITLGRRGQPGEAEAYERQALGILETRLGPDHPNVALVLANHSSRLVELGRLAEAERELQRALAIQSQHGQLQSVFAAATYGNLAGLHLQIGQADVAADEYARAAEIYRAVVGPDHPDAIDAAAGIRRARAQARQR